MFSRYDRNFAATMWRLAGERDRLRVVDDQWGHPTSAADVARAALRAALAAARDATGPDGFSGTLHVAGAPLTTWHGFATAIVETGAVHGLNAPLPVDAIETSDYPQAAARPRRVALAMDASLRALHLDPFDWRVALTEEAKARVA